jgi:Domain of unknown function DUF29
MGRREVVPPDAAQKRQPGTSLYEKDYHAWVEAQVSALERGNFAALDLAHLADEVGDLGRSEKRAIRSNLNVVLVHLIKWTYQRDRRKPGWQVSIREHRTRLKEDLADSPSLRAFPSEILAKEYDLARSKAAVQMRKALRTIPETCPFTIEQVLDLDYLPK